jgi:hypothetical protein
LSLFPSKTLSSTNRLTFFQLKSGGGCSAAKSFVERSDASGDIDDREPPIATQETGRERVAKSLQTRYCIR